MFPSNLLICSISFILVKGSIITAIRCSALKQSSCFSLLIFSLLHHLTHACWISSTSHYLTSSLCTIPSLNTLQLFAIVFRTKFKLFKMIPQTHYYFFLCNFPTSSPAFFVFIAPVNLLLPSGALTCCSLYLVQNFPVSERLALPHH